MPNGNKKKRKGGDAAGEESWQLRLYVAGQTPKSMKVVDVYQQPDLARGEQLVAAPTLIKRLPLPLRRVIGDMANKEKILVGLDLRSASGDTERAE
jgi:circadian clock protein KaiB